jgi:eukaryotic-like serine/threonine-protein kinase
MALEQGSLLYGRYRIETILGRGGMGAVYKAVDENLGIHVAVKENLFTTEEYARQFKREATLLAALRHSNLPRVTDHFVIPGQGQYLVMDYIEGEDLRTRIDRGSLPTERMVVDWGRQVCDALVYLHSRQPPVIHRDIKPGNIRITPDGRALLVDFGLARIMEGAQTTTGAKAMTPGYSPPEQYGASRTDIRTDIYSLAATLYTLVTGAVPEDGLERALGQHTLSPIRSRNPKISPSVAEAVEKGLAVLPENRFQDASEFRAALTATASSAPILSEEKPPSPTAQAAPAINSPASGAPQRNEKIRTPASSATAKQKSPARSNGLLWLLPLFGGMAGLAVVAFFIIWMAGGTSFGGILPALATNTVKAVASGAALQKTQSAETEINLPEPTKTPAPPPIPSETPAPTIIVATPIGHAQMITFAMSMDKTSPSQIYLAQMIGNSGTRLQQITDFKEGACQPDWSPDGTRMLFISPCANLESLSANTTIYEWNPTKTDPKKLLTQDYGSTVISSYASGGDYDPAWSPDGKRIAFTSIENRSPGIYIMDANGKNRVRASKSGASENSPRWSPDGNKLIFTSLTNGIMVFTSNLDGSNLMQVPSIASNPQTVAGDWSPDGGSILYLLKDNGQMYISRLDNLSNPFLRSKQYTTPHSLSARFSPDGAWIIFDIQGTNGRRDLYLYPFTGSNEPRPIVFDTDHMIKGDATWRPMPAGQ